MKPNAPRPGKEAGAKAPHRESLSELDYQTAQSRNQRANEAFDYLGARAFEAPVERTSGKSGPASSAGPRRFVDVSRLGDRRDEPARFETKRSRP